MLRTAAAASAALRRLVVASPPPSILSRAIPAAQILTRSPDLSIHHRSVPWFLIPSSSERDLSRGYASGRSLPVQSEEEEDGDDDDDDEEDIDSEDFSGEDIDDEFDDEGFGEPSDDSD